MSTDLLVLLALWCFGLFAFGLGWIMGQAFRDSAEADELMAWHHIVDSRKEWEDAA